MQQFDRNKILVYTNNRIINVCAFIVVFVLVVAWMPQVQAACTGTGTVTCTSGTGEANTITFGSADDSVVNISGTVTGAASGTTAVYDLISGSDGGVDINIAAGSNISTDLGFGSGNARVSKGSLLNLQVEASPTAYVGDMSIDIGAGSTLSGEGPLINVYFESNDDLLMQGGAGSTTINVTDSTLAAQGFQAQGIRIYDASAETGTEISSSIITLNNSDINITASSGNRAGGNLAPAPAGISVEHLRSEFVSPNVFNWQQRGDVEITLENQSSINIEGTGDGYGVQVNNGGEDSHTYVDVTNSSITIDVDGNGQGLSIANSNIRSGTDTENRVRVTNSMIMVTGDTNATGVAAQSTNFNETSDINMTISGSNVTVQSNGSASGLSTNNTAYGDSVVMVNNATNITVTGGAGSIGIDALKNYQRGGLLQVGVDASTVSVTGIDSDGIRAYSPNGSAFGVGDAAYDINITGGSTITGGSGQGAAIRGLAGFNVGTASTIDIDATSTVDGSASGIAIRDGDLDRDGVDETNTDVVVNTAGMVMGDAILGGGNDELNQTAGTLGVVYGDDKDAVNAADGNDSYTWTGGVSGGFAGSNGDDTVDANGVTVDAMAIFDGGGDMDIITFDDSMGTIDGGEFVNWETIEFNNSNLTVNDIVADGTTNTDTIKVCGGTTTFGGASTITNINDQGTHTPSACGTDETITFADTTTVTGLVETGEGADTILITGASNVTGTINTGGGDDVVTVETTGSGGTVLTEGGDDTFTWTNGGLNSFNGGDGSDIATVSSPVYDGSQSLDGGDDASSADGDVDQLFLLGVNAPNAAGSRLVNFEQITVDGGFIRINDGMLDTEELMIINNATFDASTALVLTGNLTTDSGGIFEATGGGSGVYEIGGNVTNNGTINMSDNAEGDRTRVAGDYTGTGRLQSDINTDTNGSDQLSVGGSTSGTTLIAVTDTGSGVGMNTGTGPGNGVPLVDVGGTTAAEDFVLLGDTTTADGRPALDIGAYLYTLNLASDNTHYLQSELKSGPEVIDGGGMEVITNTMSSIPTAVVRQTAAASINSTNFGVYDDTIGTLHQRVSECESQDDENPVREDCRNQYAWIRVVGDHLDLAPRSTSGVSSDIDRSYVHFGYDYELEDPDSVDGLSRWLVGINAYSGDSDLDVDDGDPNTFGSLDSDFTGFGLSATRYSPNGVYTDVIAQFTDYDSTLDTERGSTDIDGDNVAVSVELGKQYMMNEENTTILTPQAQFIWSQSDIDDFVDQDGVEYSVGDGQTALLRLGLMLQKQSDPQLVKEQQVRDQAIYGIANLYLNLDGDTSVIASGTELESNDHDSWIGAGVGGRVSLTESTKLYGEVNYQQSLDDWGDSHGYSGVIGIRKSF